MTAEQQRVQRVYDADHRMPPVRPYLAETLSHVAFAYEKSRLDLKALHKDTWFGRLWNVLNPLMLGLVYWLLVDVIFSRGAGGSSLAVLAQILGGLFIYALPSASLSLGARSIVGGGTFVLNTRLPRLLLPIGSVVSSFLMFAPSMAVYAIFHVAAGLPIGPQLIWIPILIALLTVLSLGLATTIATANVYFRDVASFLPYVTRIWMYLSPIIYLYHFFPERIRWLQHVNPLGGIFTSIQQVLIEGDHPRWTYLLSGTLWSFGLLVVGIAFFLRRERDFAVRI
jgi:teichoic acid transport system permease protein